MGFFCFCKQIRAWDSVPARAERFDKSLHNPMPFFVYGGGTMDDKWTPMEAVRVYCTQCLGMTQWNREKIQDCEGDQATNGACPFFPYRMGKRPGVSVFRKYCLYCTCGDRAYVSECPAEKCPAYPYRFGHNPAKKGQGHNAELMQKVRGAIKKPLESIFSYRDDERPVLEILGASGTINYLKTASQIEGGHANG